MVVVAFLDRVDDEVVPFGAARFLAAFAAAACFFDREGVRVEDERGGAFLADDVPHGYVGV